MECCHRQLANWRIVIRQLAVSGMLSSTSNSWGAVIHQQAAIGVLLSINRSCFHLSTSSCLGLSRWEVACWETPSIRPAGEEAAGSTDKHRGEWVLTSQVEMREGGGRKTGLGVWGGVGGTGSVVPTDPRLEDKWGRERRVYTSGPWNTHQP